MTRNGLRERHHIARQTGDNGVDDGGLPGGEDGLPGRLNDDGAAV